MVEAATDSCSSNTLITDEWFAYDAKGRTTDLWQKSPHSTTHYHAKATFFENAVPNTVQLVTPAAYTTAYTVDGEGRINSVTDTAHNKAAASAATFYPAYNPETVTVFGTDHDSFMYDTNTGNRTAFGVTVGNSIYTGALTWNANGTLQRLATTDGFFSAGNLTCNSVYDDYIRITRFDCGSGNWGPTFSWDAFDNITKTVISGRTGTSWSPGYDLSTNHYKIGSYDANGEVTSDSNNTYGWNEFKKLAWTATSGTPTCGTSGKCITYDAFGRVVETSSGASWAERFYTQAGWVSLNGTGISFAYWAAPHGGTFYESGSDGAYHYMHPDWVNSSRVASNNSHAITGDYQFTPFGETSATLRAPGFTGFLQFAGMTENFDKGVMFDADNRELSIAAGRWLSTDPARAGWNQYAYPTNPNSFIDPSGLFYCACELGDPGGGGGEDDPFGPGGGDPCFLYGLDCPGQGPTGPPIPPGGGGNPNGPNCDNDCQLQQGMQNTLFVVQNNSDCSDLIDGGTGAAAYALGVNIAAQSSGDSISTFYEMSNSIAVILFGTTQFPGDIAEEVGRGVGNPATITVDPLLYSIGCYNAEMSSTTPQMNQVFALAHDLGHAASDSLANYEGIAPDNPLYDLGMSSMINSNTVMMKCGGWQGDAPSPGPLDPPPTDVPAVAKPIHHPF